MLMLTAGEPMQEVVTYYNNHAKKIIESGIATARAIQEGYQKLVQEGIKGIPNKLTRYELQYGFSVEVTDPKEWGKIHKALGKLELYDKSPVVNDNDKKKGRKAQIIRLTLVPMGALRYNIRFHTQRKLTKRDKCQVKVVVNKTTQVVCSV